jgi:rare lipoprotein A
MRRILLICLILSITWGCAHFRKESIPPPVKKVEVGWASWYGKDFHGRKTSSGEVYDMYQLTAAHRTLPLGTRAMVTHLGNGRSVMVTINDRGPFIKGRIIDLSYAAAQVLDMAREGIAKVRVEVIEKEYIPATSPEGSFTIQVGSFVNRSNASRLMEELRKEHPDVYIQVLETPENTYYRVRLGKFKTREEAYQFAEGLAHEGYTVFMTSAE